MNTQTQPTDIALPAMLVLFGLLVLVGALSVSAALVAAPLMAGGVVAIAIGVQLVAGLSSR